MKYNLYAYHAEAQNKKKKLYLDGILFAVDVLEVFDKIEEIFISELGKRFKLNQDVLSIVEVREKSIELLNRQASGEDISPILGR